MIKASLRADRAEADQVDAQTCDLLLLSALSEAMSTEKPDEPERR
jgi:hypothetical protein